MLTIDIAVDGDECRVTHAHGTLEAKCYGDEWRIESIAVGRFRRGRGIGSAILDAFLAYVDDEFEGDWVRQVDLMVGPGWDEQGCLTRPQMIQWYGRHGFVLDERHEGWRMVRRGRSEHAREGDGARRGGAQGAADH